MAQFVSEYGKTTEPPQPDGRLDAPAFHRNHEPIWSAIGGFLAGQSGGLLEIGSGTGQHAAAFAPRAPGITWWPSDIYDSHLKSIAAWRTYSGAANLRPPQRIDLSDPDWSWTGDADRDALLTAMLCVNVLHISPWRVSKSLVCRSEPIPAKAWPPVCIRSIPARWRAYIVKQRGIRCQPAGGESRMGCARRVGPEWTRQICRLDGGRDFTDAGQ